MLSWAYICETKLRLIYEGLDKNNNKRKKKVDPCSSTDMQTAADTQICCVVFGESVHCLEGGSPLEPQTWRQRRERIDKVSAPGRNSERCEHGSQWIYFMTHRVCLDLSALHAVGTCIRSHPLLTPDHTNMHIDLAWRVHAHGQGRADLLSHKQICRHPDLLLTLSRWALRKPLRPKRLISKPKITSSSVALHLGSPCTTTLCYASAQYSSCAYVPENVHMREGACMLAAI